MARTVSMRDGTIEQDVRRERSDGPFRRADPSEPSDAEHEPRDPADAAVEAPPPEEATAAPEDAPEAGEIAAGEAREEP